MASRFIIRKTVTFLLLEGKTIAIIGYGSQGHAHALNCKGVRMRCHHRSLRGKQILGKGRGTGI